MPLPFGRATTLRPRPQSALPRHGTLGDLLASPEDGLLALDPPVPSQALRYLQDAGPEPYLLRLRDALLVPPPSGARLRPALAQLGLGPALPAGLFPGRGALLVAQGGTLLADSFGGGTTASPALRPHPDGTWTARLPAPQARIDEPCLYLEMVPGQFGHALVDMPARLWPLLRDDLAHLRDLPLLAYGTHGVTADRRSWPAATRRLLEALGVDESRVILADRPVAVRDLIVPRRVAPFRGPGGQPYHDLMARAGRRLAGARPDGAASRLFLSRSRLAGGARGLGPATEAALDALFARHGFAVVHPQEHDLSEQVAMIRGATHVAGVTGSQLHLAAFSERRGLRMLRIAPSFFVTPIDRHILAPLGGDLTEFVVPARAPRLLPPHRARWRLTEGDLRRLDGAVAGWAA